MAKDKTKITIEITIERGDCSGRMLVTPVSPEGMKLANECWSSLQPIIEEEKAYRACEDSALRMQQIQKHRT